MTFRSAPGLPAFHSIDSPPHPEEPTMKQNLSTRFTAFGLAALLTLAMLGGVNQLATSEPVPETMARAAMLDVPQS